jgi:hypothetical protein
MRSPDVQERVQYGEELEATEWPDGSNPVALPMDCYISADMLDQTNVWAHLMVENATKSQLRKDVTAIAKEYGVDLPEHEV